MKIHSWKILLRIHLALWCGALVYPPPVTAQNIPSKPYRSYEDWMVRQNVSTEYRPPVVYHFSPTPFPIFQVNQYPDASPQNEPSVRINPANIDNIVVAYRDFHLGWNPAVRNVGIAATTDGGKTWTEQLAKFINHDRFSDPAVGVDLEGTFYISTLDWHQVGYSNDSTMVSVRRSTDGGLTWLPAVPVGPFGSNYDKDMIGVDDGPSSPYRGYIYDAWDGVLAFARSTDGGRNFTPSADSVYVMYPAIATGPAGELYVIGAGLWGKKSIDGGVHSSVFHIGDTIHPPSDGVAISAGLWSVCEPVAGVDKNESSPRKGTVYIVYSSTVTGDGDLYCVRSTDGAATWSPSVRVNNDTVGNGRDQFHFWMIVDDSGFVDVVFLDRRNDPNNLLCDAYFAQSRDGGQSFRNYKITGQNFDPTITPNGEVRLGEYIGIDARKNRIVPVWVDTHRGNQDIDIAVIDLNSVGSIEGNVTGGNIPGHSSPAVLLFHDNGIDSAFVGESGHYRFEGLYAGTYTVSLQGGYVALPDTHSVTLGDRGVVTGEDFTIITGINEAGNALPQTFRLLQNCPNPFNPSTRLSYSLPTASHVRLTVGNILGQTVETIVDGVEQAGVHTHEWNAGPLSSGVYFYRMEAASVADPARRFTGVKNMLLIR